MISSDPLDGHFFVVEEEFGRISSVDPSMIAANTVETWMDDNESDNCLLCHEQFSIFKRRHHCRYCGLLFCGKCAYNSTIINNNIERICDSCAAIILPPNTSSNSYPGLRKFAASNNIKPFNPKIAAFSFISSLFSDSKESSHRYAINTLLKLYKSHAPEMIKSNVPYELLKHIINCKCDALSSTIDLFVSLYMADPSGCNIDFSLEPFCNIDINMFFSYDSIEMKRAASRFLYLLISEGHIHISNIVNLLGLLDCPDKWVTAFIIASMAFKIPRCDTDSIFTRKFSSKKIFETNSELLTQILKLFDPNSKNSSAAARYYAAVTLEYLCHFPEDLQIIASLDCSNLVTSLSQCFPKDSNDDRSEIKTALYLTSLVYQIWKAVDEGLLNEEQIKNQFSFILFPLFDIIGIENNNTGQCLLSVLQIKFLEIMRVISKQENIKSVVFSEQMHEILNKLAQNQSRLGEEAQLTLKTFEQNNN